VTLRQRLEYGDGGAADQPPTERDAARTSNLLGQLIRHHDEAGLVTVVSVDFKGNLLEKFRRVIADVAPIPVAAHFHDTRGLGLANVLAAFAAGCKAFDASLGGLGGCPYAPGATGNIVLEDTVFMFESMGLETGIDLDKLAQARDVVARALPEVTLYGAIAKAGVPRNFHPVANAA